MRDRPSLSEFDQSNVAAVLDALMGSSFRGKFRLDARDHAYLLHRGNDIILRHARRFVIARIAPARPHNDGRQTPTRGHPAFVAQHATATCCRSCLEKWHGVSPDRLLTDAEVEGAVALIAGWLRRQPTPASDAPPLFADRDALSEHETEEPG